MNYYIVTNDRFRQYVFLRSDRDRAYRFASRFGFEVRPASEIPFCVGITVYP